jgi:hypothetical protein
MSVFCNVCLYLPNLKMSALLNSIFSMPLKSFLPICKAVESMSYPTILFTVLCSRLPKMLLYQQPKTAMLELVFIIFYII